MRFEQRYQFQLEPQTAHVLSNAVAEEALKNISPDRVWNELKLIFAENDPVKSLRRLAELGIWPQIIPGLEWKNSIQESLNKVIPVITAVADITGVSLERWLVFLTVILRETDETSAVAWLDQLSITKEQRSSLKRCLEEDSAAMLQDLETPGPGELHKLLKDCSPLGMALILLFIKGQVEQNVYQYFRLRTRLPQLLKMDGKVLGKMGIEPGPVYGKVLFALEAAVLEGKVETVQDQQRFVRNWLESKGVL